MEDDYHKAAVMLHSGTPEQKKQAENFIRNGNPNPSLFIEKSYKLPSGGIVSVSESIHETANALANRFYVAMGGHISRPGFDYSASQHPTEQAMYTMALEAIDYEAEYGF